MSVNMSASTTTKLKIVFGAMTTGKPGTVGSRVDTVEEGGKLLDIFQAHGYNEIDTARVYGNGTTEEMLGELKWQDRKIVMGTKLYPNAGTQYAQNIDLFYLHGPDRKTPFEDTLREMNKLHEEGHFNRFGISNYMSWEVAQMSEICIRNNWIRPNIYQGVYHALQRTTEAGLFPCLHFYNISLYAFRPLSGGFLTGRYTRDQQEFEAGSRFDPKIMQGKLYHGRYWNEAYFDRFGSHTSCRWMEHHSLMKRENGDAVIVGASSVKHLEENLNDLEKCPLPDDVVETLEKAWLGVKGVAPKYWH
ncbi:NADP-dependent oxidoreductase domain-containing protein [Rhexocercosporidium sp. MPI-PUGE-AT-0058]|nr:NADP-dependent oxidoreductase domain-containing protein [Rhexocercosporidium sp. MPI-PUGE-AT-0058]